MYKPASKCGDPAVIGRPQPVRHCATAGLSLAIAAGGTVLCSHITRSLAVLQLPAEVRCLDSTTASCRLHLHSAPAKRLSDPLCLCPRLPAGGTGVGMHRGDCT